MQTTFGMGKLLLELFFLTVLHAFPRPNVAQARAGYKSTVKTKERKTNNHASFGGSLLQNNMEVEAAIEMAWHLDETGLYWVWSKFAWFVRVWLV